MEKYPVVSTGYFLGKRHTVPQCSKFQFIGLLNRYRITHVIARLHFPVAVPGSFLGANACVICRPLPLAQLP